MSEFVERFLWIGAIGIAVTYASFLFFGSVIERMSAKEFERVVAIDSVLPGIHHLSGTVLVPSPCHTLSVDVERIGPADYHVMFKTWAEPYRDCDPAPTPKKFRTVTFAPSVGVTFTASLDEKPLPFHVIAIYP